MLTHGTWDRRVLGSGRWRLATGLAAAVIISLALGACTKDPNVLKQRHVEKGGSYLKDRKYNEAILAFRNAVQIDPNYVDAHVGLARTYRRKGWVIDARNEYEKAMQLRGDAPDLRLELA